MKMKACVKMFLGIAVAAAMTGCYVAPVMPPGGLIYSDIRSPIDIDAEQTNITMNEGRSSSASVLGLVAWGDSSVTTAAREGNLRQVDHVDYEFKNIVGIYQQFTTVAQGQ